MNDLVDITPDDSLVPVYLDPTPIENLPVELPDSETVDAARQAGINKLMALGLTEEEARALAGG